MLRVLMFDLGGTLERDGAPLPHVRECLEAMTWFKTQDGATVEHCLVSDFHAAEPFTDNNVAGILDQYLAILDGLGLRDIFEPAERRVTLSTHAGVTKPDRRVFDLALTRLGSSVALEECLFVTENAGHVAATRALGMESLHFGADAPEGFSAWPEGILQIALRVDPGGRDNVALALGILGQTAGVADVVNVVTGAPRITADAHALVELDDSSLGALEGVHVPMPAKLEVDFDTGTPRLEVHVPDGAKQEAAAYVRSLQAHGKVSGAPDSPLGPPTHSVETDASGRRILKRRGFD